jgi:elongation factor Ts
MTKIDAKTVKQLRDMTGAPMMDCKSALGETGGDVEKARDVLRKRGQQVADKASGRSVSEGLIYSYSHHNGKLAVMVEIVCETDFVAMNEDFKAFCHGVALSVTAFNPAYLDKSNVPAEAVEKEQAIVTEMTRESMAGKPENVIEKAVNGRMEKWFGEQTLMDKPYVPDDSKTIEQMRTELVGKIGENIQVRRFVRMELGG